MPPRAWIAISASVCEGPGVEHRIGNFREKLTWTSIGYWKPRLNWATLITATMFDIEFGVRCGLVEVYGPRLVMGFPGNGLEMAQFSANSTFFWQLSRRKLKRKKKWLHRRFCTLFPRDYLYLVTSWGSRKRDIKTFSSQDSSRFPDFCEIL